MRLLSVSMLLVLGGCWVSDDDALKYYDRDGDGVYVSEGAAFGATAPFDCDDADPNVFPGAAEHCDGLDEDCDDDVDEGAVDGTTFFRDADQDGYGVDTDTIVACAAPELYATVGGDCDDSNATVRPTDWYADTDGDGFGDPEAVTFACDQPADHVADATDCDDADTTVAPGADEICDDDVDNDCDGDIDGNDTGPGDLVWYLDDDGDGFGDATVSVSSCAPPTDHVADATDCNDADVGIYPGADEHCDGVDEDCDEAADNDPVDGTTWYRDADRDGYGSETDSVVACTAPELYIATGGDCDDTNATVLPTEWYADADGDGYGDPDVTTYACGQPADHVANTDDCDDSSAAIKPGATEDCDDTVDNDCDGAVDAADTGPGDTPWYADADGDSYGDAASISYSCVAPTNHVADATDCDDDATGVNPGATELCESGTDEDCDSLDATCGFAGILGLTSDASATFIGRATGGDAAGHAVAVGDWDGDGYDDLAIAAPVASGYSGEVALYYGAYDLTLGGHTLTSAPRYTGTGGCVLGHHLGSPGDLDQDGYDELLVGCQLGDTVDGKPYLIYGGSTRLTTSTAVTGVVLQGESLTGAGVGSAGADLTEDGFPDLLVGAAQGTPADGAVYILTGSSTRLSGTVALSSADRIIRGVASDRIGKAIAVVTDADGDGAPEVAVGSTPGAGIVYLFADLTATGSYVVTSADFTLTGTTIDDGAGSQVLAPGDLDADGYGDLLVAADGYDSGSGRVYVWRGSASAWTGSTALADTTTQLEAPSAGAELGASLGAGDFDADGIVDIAVGAPFATVGSYSEAGVVLVYQGDTLTGVVASTGSVAELQGAWTDSRAGAAIATGDHNGDGIGDLLVGADGNFGAAVGSTFLLYGAP